MKKQKLIVDDEIDRFENIVNDELDKGAVIVPGTLVISTSITFAASVARTIRNNAYAVVMEYPDQLEKQVLNS